MKHMLFLATYALWWFRGRSITIVACLALTMWLPVTVRMMLTQFRSEVTARASSTPLLTGAAGSRIDLTLHSLYFEGGPPATTSMAEADRIQDAGFADAIPLYVKYKTQPRNDHPGAVIVGTSPDYFEFRNLELLQGQPLALLGDCVVGAAAAEKLGLKPGDTILSAPRNAFDLAGDYPLKLNVCGILRPAYSPDDHVVFVDTRTVWIIDGIGHGHQKLTSGSDEKLVLNTSGKSVTASAAVLPYTEITADNIDSFHFHGDPTDFPLSSVVAVPHSERDRILFRGRYQSNHSLTQCVQPAEVVSELLDVVFRVEQFVRISSLVAAAVTMALLALVLSLSLRLRQSEINTLFRLGCSRSMIAGMIFAELVLMLLASAILALLMAMLTQSLFNDALRQLLF